MPTAQREKGSLFHQRLPALVRSQNRVFLGKTGGDAPVKSLSRKAVFGQRDFQGHADLLHSYVPTATSVSVLFDVRRPSAIRGRVSAVVVDSIKGMIRRRFWTHIGEEVIERFHPTFANRDAAPAVVFEDRRRGVGAPMFHRRPSLVLRGRLACRAVPVAKLNRCTVLTPTLDAVATARLRSAADQNLSADRFRFGAARALANVLPEFLDVANHCPSSKNVAREIVSLHGVGYYQTQGQSGK